MKFKNFELNKKWKTWHQKIRFCGHITITPFFITWSMFHHRRKIQVTNRELIIKVIDYWPFFGFSESGKQILNSPTSRLKYRTSSSKSFWEETGSLSSIYVRFTRISYQLSVPKAIARQATATTAVIVANDKVTAEQAIGNFAPRKQNFFKRRVWEEQNKSHR